MSIAPEWERVIEVTLFCGVLNLLWNLVTKRDACNTFFQVTEMTFFGLVLGMMLVFEWRVFRDGMAFIFGVAVVGMFAVGLVHHRGTKTKNHSRKP